MTVYDASDKVDVTDILAQPAMWAARLRAVQAERDQLVEALARMRAERDQALADAAVGGELIGIVSALQADLDAAGDELVSLRGQLQSADH